MTHQEQYSQTACTCGRHFTGRAFMLTAGAALGATIMYFADPNRGKARRMDLWQRAMRVTRRGGHVLTKHAEDLLNRAKGAIAEANAALGPLEGFGNDKATEERVRSRLGHVTQNTAAIQTEVTGGVVTLRGAVPRQNHRHVVDEVLTVPGVTGVRDHLALAG